MVGAAGHHVGGDAGRHHQRDGQRLRPHAPQVPQELAIEHAHGAHQLIADGGLRVSFTCMPVMRPSPNSSTRCAISLMAALWVMSAVVVPSSTLTCDSASSTRIPVLLSSAPVG